MAIQMPRWALWGGGAVLAGGAGFILWKKRQSAASANQSSTGSAYGAPLPGTAIIEPIQTIPGPPGPPGPPGKNAKPPPKKHPKPKHHPKPKPGSSGPGPGHGGGGQPPTPRPARTPGITYDVKPGDTLSDIAEDFYGIPTDWPLIYNANRRVIGDNPNLIYPGEDLKIPGVTHGPNE